MEIKLGTALTYDDVVLEPRYSTLKSRSEASTKVNISKWDLLHPIVSANMDSITGVKMAQAMHTTGSVGFLHRYLTPENTILHIQELKAQNVSPICVSIGVGPNDLKNAQSYINAGADWICVDIAHGHSLNMRSLLQTLTAWRKLSNKDFLIIAGNVATEDGARDLAVWGADAIKAGIANGGVCHTKYVSGHGKPQLSTIIECAKGLESTYWRTPKYLIADGGIRTSGDIVKAIAAGADLCMVGGILAGTNECPLEGVYRGMASAEAQLDFRGEIGNRVAEGISTMVQSKGPVQDVIDGLIGGLRSGMSYSNARNLRQLRDNAIFSLVTLNFNKK